MKCSLKQRDSNHPRRKSSVLIIHLLQNLSVPYPVRLYNLTGMRVATISTICQGININKYKDCKAPPNTHPPIKTHKQHHRITWQTAKEINHKTTYPLTIQTLITKHNNRSKILLTKILNQTQISHKKDTTLTWKKISVIIRLSIWSFFKICIKQIKSRNKFWRKKRKERKLNTLKLNNSLGLLMYKESSILYCRKRHLLKLYEQNLLKNIPRHQQNSSSLHLHKQIMINQKCQKQLKILNKKINSICKKSRKREPCNKRKNNKKY